MYNIYIDNEITKIEVYKSIGLCSFIIIQIIVNIMYF